MLQIGSFKGLQLHMLHARSLSGCLQGTIEKASLMLRWHSAEAGAILGGRKVGNKSSFDLSTKAVTRAI